MALLSSIMHRPPVTFLLAGQALGPWWSEAGYRAATACLSVSFMVRPGPVL